MRRFALYIIFSVLICLPCFSFETKLTNNGAKTVFVYHIPEEEPQEQEQEQEEVEDIISDDITADTSREVEILDNDNYEISDMYNTVLQGYAEYNDIDETDGIVLEDFDILSLNIRQPVKVGTKKYTSLTQTPSLFASDKFSKHTGTEYSIAPVSTKNSRSLESPFGNFSAGTLYSQGIDTGELEQSSGVFYKYKYKRFSITTSYLKTVNSTNNTYNDNFYVAPELELNQYFSLKEILSEDTVKRRKKAELVLSINPFGNKDTDRLRFELGASQTYDDNNNLFKSQFKFSTNFKL